MERTPTARAEGCPVVIIGGGPAGLFCALQAAGAGRRVVVLEKNASCGRKLLITGTGQCNLTNTGDISEFLVHYGDHGPFLRHALRGFTNRDLRAFLSEQGLATTAEPGGKVFPASRKAQDVLSLLLSACSKRGVAVRCSEPVQSVASTGEGFVVTTERAVYHAACCVVATGGVSYPATGSTGDGYAFARVLGHAVTDVAPALAAVTVADFPYADCAGISFENLQVSLYRGGKKIRQQSGDLLFTHHGLSGPAVLHLSRFTRAGDVLAVSFLPGRDPQQLDRELTGTIAAHGQRLVRALLLDYTLPERFVRRLLDVAGIPADQTGAHLSREKRSAIIANLTGHAFTVKEVAGFDRAMVTAGGVALEAINPKTMESRQVPGLFFVGEVLDIDGDTGGYNLQAAFSTAAAAARRIRAICSGQGHGTLG
ncbi:MAG: NAD(P)/FAD-dependent oxidoreductase [Methanomicrobiales archaeon]|nr:NAD(P)/FAD-dependent oxidoreductase [Methanomicrobiales archaeon]